MTTPRLRPADPRRRGSALLMAVLVLLVVVAITFQLSISTGTDARVARNDVALTTMDLAIESALLKVYETLALDGDQGASDPGAGAAAPGTASGSMPGVPGASGASGEAGGEAAAVDSREDEWARPQRTEINKIELRILVQDEDAKLNVLGMLTEDEEEADKHFERVVRVLDFCREGTSEDIDVSDARRMAEAIRIHLNERVSSVTPMPTLATYDEEHPDRGLPLTLKEFEVLEPFHEGLFRDYRGEHGEIVHSIGSFLTVWTSITSQGAAGSGSGSSGSGSGGSGSGDGGGDTGSGGGDDGGDPSDPGATIAGMDPSELQGTNINGGGGQGGGRGGTGAQAGSGGTNTGQGSEGSGSSGQTAAGASEGVFGVAVNVNTAAVAVLKALIDDRDVPSRWWDRVIEYRNLEEEPEDGSDDPEPTFDEYGNEIFTRRVFDDLDELEEVPGTDDLGPAERARVRQLLTTKSQIFSIYVTARRATGQSTEFGGYLGARRGEEKEDMQGTAITRTVRSIVWRTTQGDTTVIVPIVRWEVLDYTPFEVLDYPDEDR